MHTWRWTANAFEGPLRQQPKHLQPHFPLAQARILSLRLQTNRSELLRFSIITVFSFYSKYLHKVGFLPKTRWIPKQKMGPAQQIIKTYPKHKILPMITFQTTVQPISSLHIISQNKSDTPICYLTLLLINKVSFANALWSPE